MGLQNLSNIFKNNPPDTSDITQNSLDDVSSANSLVSDMSKNSSNFKYYSPFPTPDSDFQNASIRLLSGQSLIEDDKHTFGTKGAQDELIKIDRIKFLQYLSPLSERKHTFFGLLGQ